MTKKKNTIDTEKQQTIKKPRVPKVKAASQTFIEDTFDLNSNNTNVKTEIIIENTILEKQKKYISYNDLLKNKQFQIKFNTLKAQIEFEKSFNVLLDFLSLSKLYKTFQIDKDTDEIDVLLNELVAYFKTRLARITLSYTDYNNINIYFETIKTIYYRFNNGELSINEDLKKELDKAISMNEYIKKLLF